MGGITGADDLAAQRILAALLRFNLKWKYSELCGFSEVEDITNNSEVKHPDPLRPSIQRGANPAATEAVGLSSYGTTCAMEGLENGSAGATGGKTAVIGVGVKQGKKRIWCIAGVE